MAARDAHLTIVARIARDSSVGRVPRWSGEIRVRDDRGRWVGSRTIDREGLSCQPLESALALVTALVLAQEDVAIEVAPPVVPPTSEPPPTRASPAESRAVPLPAEAGARAKAEAPASPGVTAHAAQPSPLARTWTVGVEGGFTTWFGMLPDPTVGANLSAFVRFARGLKVFATGGTSAQQTVLTGTDRGTLLKFSGVGAGVCPLGATWRTFSGHLCARVDLGWLRAEGFGFAVTGTQVRPVVDTGAALEVRKPLLGPLYVGLSAGLVAPLLRDRISYADDGGVVHPIFRPAAVVGLGEFRLGATF